MSSKTVSVPFTSSLVPVPVERSAASISVGPPRLSGGLSRDRNSHAFPGTACLVSFRAVLPGPHDKERHR
jgi:hypothetical protein